MSNYTIKSGDNLWNIVKREFKISSNAEISKKVSEIAKNNGISNPNLIYAGNKIEIGDAMDKLEKSEPEKTDTPVQNPIASTDTPEIIKAVEDKMKSSDIKNYDEYMGSLSSKVSIFSDSVKTNEDMQKAYTDYSQRLLLKKYDVNADGKVTTEEFAEIEEKDRYNILDIRSKKIDNDAKLLAEQNPELLAIYDKDKDGKISEEEYTAGLEELNSDRTQNFEYNKLLAGRNANLFAKNLDMNADGIISKEELGFFNKVADGLDGKDDGVIKAGPEVSMFKSVTGVNADNKDINFVVNKYLTGQTLSADEQKILDESTVKIRKALSKAAGLTPAE